MNLIIPMAGKGTRMRPSTLVTPKPLFPIADKPIVEWLVYEVFLSTNLPIKEIAFVIHPEFGKKVESDLLQIAEKYRAQGRIYYQEQALGTAHAILCAQPSLKDNVLITFADTLFKAQFNIDTQKDAIIWTKKVDNPQQYGIVITNETHQILYFEEKPTNPISNDAIIGIYFFKDGQYLAEELQYLIDNHIKEKGEYQLTNAMENMRQKGKALYSQNVELWLDCGHKDTTLYSHQVVLQMHSISSSHQKKVINSQIIEPCYIADDVIIENSTIGPYVSIGKNSHIRNARIENSIMMTHVKVFNTHIHKSIIGNYAHIEGRSRAPLLSMHISDYSQIEIE